MTAPSAKQAAHGSDGTTTCTTTPTIHVVNATAPIAYSRIGFRCRLKSVQTKKYAPSISNGGRNTISTRSGSSTTGGKPGTNAIAAPPTSNAAAGGSRKRFAISSSAMIAISESSTSLNADTADMTSPVERL